MIMNYATAGSEAGYLTSAYQMPMLSEAEEKELALRFHKDGDLNAAKKLVLSHLRFVIKIARGYKGYGLAQQDLVQEGTVGLMKAVKRFDPEFGVRLVSFAVHWIKAEMHEYILRNWRIVKIATTKAQRKLFFNLRSSKKRLGWFNDAEVQSVAKDLGVEPEVVVEMESRLSGQDIAFEIEQDDEENLSFNPSAQLVDLSEGPAQLYETERSDSNKQVQLLKALETLDQRSLEIIKARWLTDKKATLHELAKKYQVSAERIRQIEKKAMKKMQQLIENNALGTCTK